jgi:hypothetical protein
MILWNDSLMISVSKIQKDENMGLLVFKCGVPESLSQKKRPAFFGHEYVVTPKGKSFVNVWETFANLL